MRRHVVKAARHTAKAVANGPVQSVVVSILIFLGGPTTVFIQNHSSRQAMVAALGVWWASVAYGLIYLAIATLILFLWNLAASPFHLQKERADTEKNRADELEKHLADQRRDALTIRQIEMMERDTAARERETDRYYHQFSDGAAILRAKNREKDRILSERATAPDPSPVGPKPTKPPSGTKRGKRRG